MGRERVKFVGDGRWHKYPKELPEKSGVYLTTLRYYDLTVDGRVIEKDRQVEYFYWLDSTDGWLYYSPDGEMNSLYYPDNGSYEIIAWADNVAPYTGKVFNKELMRDDAPCPSYEEEVEW